jgi:hypothetical protein
LKLLDYVILCLPLACYAAFYAWREKNDVRAAAKKRALPKPLSAAVGRCVSTRGVGPEGALLPRCARGAAAP